MLELIDIRKSFNKGTPDEAVLFDGFHFSVEEGEFVSIVGSNGSGKTTLLNLVAGSMQPDAGRILLRGQDITAQKEFVRARRIGRVFQDPALGAAGHMTIAENLAIAENKGKPFGLSAGLSKARVAAYRDLLHPLGLGLEDRMNVPVGALSGGQRQVLTLVIATLTPVDVLLLDEHTAALDPKTAEQTMVLTDRIVREKKLTTLMVTHNLRFAEQYGTRLCMFDKGRVGLDAAGEAKRAQKVDDLLAMFNAISIECGN